MSKFCRLTEASMQVEQRSIDCATPTKSTTTIIVLFIDINNIVQRRSKI
jgi:hypothetical protein